ncbi:MAG: MFS transporter, partial [Salinispira sp.]
YYLLIVARSITGFGTGMGYIALRSFINLEGRDEIRNKAYSNFYSGMIGGINVGLVLGASLAAWVGYSNVFVIGLVLLIVTAILFATLYRDAKFFWPREESSNLTHGQALFSLIKSPRLWVYFIFLLLPTYAAAAYVGFYFPLFGENVLGLSTPQIGRFMIMNGLLIVYLGPPLSRFIERKIGNYWGSILGSIFWGLTLVIAGLTGNIFAVAIVLILMGLTEGFAVSTQNGLYFSEKIISVVGQDRSTGYFEFFGKIGDTIGPVIFASVLILGARTGLITLGIVIAAMTVPYILFIRNPAGRKKIAREN